MEALLEWSAVADRDIGGDSQEDELRYDSLDPSLVVGGEVRTQDKERLRSTPFIGLLQRHPISFKTGIFNAFRIELKSDGRPIELEMVVYSPIRGFLFGRCFIISKVQEWRTYELPFRNMEILGEEAKSLAEQNDPKRISVHSILET